MRLSNPAESEHYVDHRENDDQPRGDLHQALTAELNATAAAEIRISLKCISTMFYRKSLQMQERGAR